ncbi:MAG TPA: TIGR03435 family protein [Bryobacteraceae bacterium]|nr:TIGR03435 family protein [Bryobacteraceae bacterium]
MRRINLRTATVKNAGVGAALLLAITASSAFAQQNRRFEVASIKPSQNRNFIGMDLRPGGRLMANGPLALLVANAYRMKHFQILGGPAWINSDLYSVDARAEEAASRAEMLLALQALLADRFKLNIERQTRVLGVYVLTIGQSGVKRELLSAGGCSAAEPDKPVGPPQLGQLPCGRVTMMFSRERTQLEGRHVSIADLIERLSSFVDRPIIDKTGYSGTLDVKLEFTPDQAALGFFGGLLPPAQPSPPDENAISLSTAAREQLGLKLESAKGPVNVIMIRHVERPSVN